MVLGGSHLRVLHAWFWHPGGKVGLSQQLGKTGRHSAAQGLPQPPGLGKGKLCPPAQPSPIPAPVPQCHSCSSPAHTSFSRTSEPPLCSSFSLVGPGWASQLAWPALGEGLHLGAPPRTPLSERQPISQPSPAWFSPICSQPSRRQCQELGHHLRGLRTPWKQPCFP